MIRLSCIFLFLLPAAVSLAAGSAADFRTIAIFESERLLETDAGARLVAYFEARDPAVRSRAVLAAGHIGNKAVIPELRSPAGDSAVEVRRMTAFALGQIRAKEGLPLVAQLLKDEDPETRRLAVEACGRIGGIESSRMIRPFFDDSRLEMREQAALAEALIKDKALLDLLIQKTATADNAQWSYVYALYRLADEKAVPALHAVIADPQPSPSTGDPSSVLFALKALWSMKKPLTPEEAGQLLSASDARIHQNALDVMGALGDAAACDAIRAHMEKLPVASQWKAIDAMGALGCSTVEEKMKYLAAPVPELRASALKLIGVKDVEKYVQVFDRASRDDSYLVRLQCATSCSTLSADSALPILNRLMKDADGGVRVAALQSLGSFLPRTEDLLRPFLNSKDTVERAVVLEAMGKTKDRKYIPLLVDAFRSYTDLDTQTTVLDALPDFADSTTLELLEKSLMDTRYVVRKHAIDALKKIEGGASYFLNGSVVDLYSFLNLKGKITTAAMKSYPGAFGSPVGNREAVIQLEKGAVRIRLLGEQAPAHVQNFITLAEKGFYRGLRIHRVVPNFVIQGGDPRGDGWGNAGYLVQDQYNTIPYLRGKVGMPTSGKDSGGCQFFITMSRQPHLDGNYTVFGEVISGMEFVDATRPGDRIVNITIEK